jgi:hypothetical protein
MAATVSPFSLSCETELVLDNRTALGNMKSERGRERDKGLERAHKLDLLFVLAVDWFIKAGKTEEALKILITT